MLTTFIPLVFDIMNETIPKISVIVPVYKAEAYLHRCVDSILAQTFQDFEVLLVDDGSPDRSGEICDEYAQKDTRVRVFHKENGGVSSTRNKGIQEANSEYICFMDSDDCVGENYLMHLMCGDADLIVSGLTYVSDSGEVMHHIPYSCIATDSKAIGMSIPGLENLYLLNGPYQKRFRKDLLSKNNVSFDEECSNGEDTLFVLEYIQYISSMIVVPYSDYFYYRAKNGTLSTQRSPYWIAYKFANKMFNMRSDMIKRFEITDCEYCKYIHLLYIDYLFVSVYSLYYQKIPRCKRLEFLAIVFRENKSLKVIIGKRMHLRNVISMLLLKTQSTLVADLFYNIVFKLKSK